MLFETGDVFETVTGQVFRVDAGYRMYFICHPIERKDGVTVERLDDIRVYVNDTDDFDEYNIIVERIKKTALPLTTMKVGAEWFPEKFYLEKEDMKS